MEKEESCLKCLSCIPRQKKKILFVFVVFNIICWFLYYNSCHLSYFNYETKPNTVKHVYTSIYNVPLFHIPLLSDKDMTVFYIEIYSGIWCFRLGIILNESQRIKKCNCAKNWFGLDCGIPAAIWKSSFLQEGKHTGIEIRRRKKPRRIIVSFAVDDHIDLFDINIHNAFSVADLFLTIEEKDHNPSILNMFKEGYLVEYQSKIIPMQLGKSVVNQIGNNWSVFMLNELWTVGWKRLTDFRPDDIFLFSHVSSILSKDVLLFLKLYDGFPEPFFFELRPLLFKFWREMKSNSTSSNFVPFKPLGCTFQFISSMCDFKVMEVFSNNCFTDLHHKKEFEKNYWPLKNWSIGNTLAPSGWQCNLCCKNECIQKSIHRLLPKRNNTVSFPLHFSQLNSSVIEHFVKTNNLFNSKELSFEIVSSKNSFFAPEIVIKNSQYSHLIDLGP